MGMITAQQGWHDICRRFTSIIYICNENIMSDIYPIFRSWKYRVASLLGDKPTARQPTGRHALVNWTTMPPTFLRFCACVDFC